MEKRRPLRRKPNDHNFGLLIMLAVTAGAFLLSDMGRHKGTLLLSSGVANPLKAEGSDGFSRSDGVALARQSVTAWTLVIRLGKG
jgi:hypothetical protein